MAAVYDKLWKLVIFLEVVAIDPDLILAGKG
jgi:hypothetical protein